MKIRALYLSALIAVFMTQFARAARAVRGIWQLHKDRDLWVFWTLEDCISAKTTAGGGVCISN
jgi:hypothetical protein